MPGWRPSASSSVDVKVVTDRSRLRTVLVPVLYGSYEKLSRQTGWNPRIPLEQSLRDTYSYWLQRQSTAGAQLH